MLHRVRRDLIRGDGYTLIELLVVILVIGVLASIALPVFLGQREQAQDAEAKSAAGNMAHQIEVCATATGTYAGCEISVTSATTGLPVGPGPGEVRVEGTPTETDYVVIARSGANAGARTYTVARSGSSTVHSCAPSGGGCDGTSW